MSLEHIIIGGGIAGASLAWRLSQEGTNVLLLDSGESASLVASGLVNPITGRKISLKYKIKPRLEALEEFYSSLKPYQKSPLKRECLLFRSLGEEELKNLHERLKTEKELKSLILDLLPQAPAREFKSGPGLLTQAQHINVKSVLQLIKTELTKRRQYQHGHVDLSKLKKTSIGWQVDKYECCSLTLAQGWLASQLGPFRFLPFVPAKGELIIVELAQELSRPDIFFKRYEIFSPLNKTQAIFGSTFSWNELNTQPNIKTGEYLQQKLKSMITTAFTIKKHLAHVRPATKDRKPFLGSHPVHKNLFIFNGLGSLGLSLAPLYSQQLAQFILEKKELDDEVKICRYRSFL